MLNCLNRVGVGIISPLNVYNTHTECNILGAAIGAASSLVGGLLGKKSQSNANATNLQIARETNASNQQLAEQQNQWNIDQWNRENEYNSAAAQKQRLIDAGMNPYWSSVTPGTAQNVQSAPMANQQMAHVEPENAMANAVENAGVSAFQQLMNEKMTAANVRKAEADAITAETQAKLNSSQEQLNQIGAKRQLGTMPFDIEQAKQLSLHTTATNELIKLQAENQDWANMLQKKYGDVLNIAQLENLAAQKWKTVSDRHVNEATLNKIASEIAKNYAESNHLNADTNTINAIRSYVVNDYKLTNTKTQYENDVLKVNSDWQQKHGAESLNQQLDASKFENGTFNRYVKPFIPGVTAVGGALLLKGKGKGKPYTGKHSRLVNAIRSRNPFYSGDD